MLEFLMTIPGLLLGLAFLMNFGMMQFWFWALHDREIEAWVPLYFILIHLFLCVVLTLVIFEGAAGAL